MKNIFVVIALVIGGAGFFYGYKEHAKVELFDSAITELKERNDKLEKNLKLAQSDLADASSIPSPHSAPVATSTPPAVNPNQQISARLRQLLKHLDEEGAALQRINAQLGDIDEGTIERQRQGDLEKDLVNLKSDQVNLTQQLKRIQSRRQELTRTDRTRQVNVQYAKIETVEQLNRQIQVRQAKIDRIEHQIDVLRARGESSSVAQRIASLQEQVRTERTAIESLTQRVDLATDRRDMNMAADRIKYEDEDVYLVNLSKRLQDQFTVNEKAIAKTQSQIADLKARNHKKSDTVNSLTSKRDMYLKSIDELQSKIAAERRKISR